MIRRIRQVVLVFGDVFLALLSLFLTLFLRYWGEFSWLRFWQHFLPFSLLYFFWFLLLYIFGLYDLNLIRPKLELLKRTGQCLLICFLLGMVFFYLIPIFKIAPKTNLLINIFIFGGLILVWRRSFYYLFSSYLLQNVGFLGKTPLAQRLAKEFKQNPQLGYKVVKFLNPKKSVFKQVKKEKIDVLIIARDLRKNQKLIGELFNCLPLKITFMDLAQAYETLLYKIPIDFVSQSWFLENLREGEKRIYDNLKRLADIIAALFIIALTSPLWLLFAILIKLEDKGPVFYKQLRVGKDRKEFLLWKFRSMKVGAEKRGKPKWAEKEDPRVTKVGKVLRKLHLDELPQ
jgi:hypothetical protein